MSLLRTESRPWIESRREERSPGGWLLPFRVLRPDDETDFLAFSLPDAIATSLSANAGLIEL